jgi:hypothetical protein
MTDLKRYALFAYDTYYPGGGWSDFVRSFDTVDEAAQHGRQLRDDYKVVIDLRTGEDVTPADLI